MQFLHRNFVLTILLLALFCVPMPAFASLDSLTVTIDETESEFQAFSNGTSLFMTASDIASIFDVEYTQDLQKGNVIYTLHKSFFSKKEAIFTVGSNIATVNGKELTLDAVPIINESTMLIPVKAVCSIWEASYGANEEAVYICTDGRDVIVPEIQKVFVEQQPVAIGDKTSPIRYIHIPASSHIKTDIVFAQNTLGKVEELDSMAKRTSAKAAINGGFFQSYDVSKAQEPYGILIKDGKLIHSDNTGSTLGFTKDGKIKLDVVRSVITVTVNNSEYTVSLMNHTPAIDSSTIAIFTSAYGETVNNPGIAIVVQNGIINAVCEDKIVTIPKDGYVLLFTGNNTSITSNMQKGDTVSYAVSYVNAHNANADWTDVKTAIGAGPILLDGGEIVLNPANEGFTDETSFQISVARSAIGITEDGSVLLVGNVNCTAEELASIMLELGAIQAIAMDSGSSSGLYCTAEETVAAPMKAISNALIFK